jgi:hypothetical protein
MEMGFVVGLAAMTFAVIGAVVYFGVRVSRAVEKNTPRSPMAATLTSTGLALSGCMIALLVLFAAASTLEPEGSLGAFLRSPEGLVAALLGTVVFFAVASAIFDKLGYPIVKREKNAGPRRK